MTRPYREIVITGDPVRGMQFHGPFPTHGDACRWGEASGYDDWWVTKLTAPAELHPTDIARAETYFPRKEVR